MVQMRENLLQMSDHNQHCPLLAVCDLHQNRAVVPRRFSRGFGKCISSMCRTGLTADSKSGIFHCESNCRRSLLCLFNKSNNQTSGLLVPSEPPEQHLTRTTYPSCVKPHTRRTTNLRGPTFTLVTQFMPKIKLITFLNEWGKILPLRSEGQFTKHVTEGVRMI
jgi:hypothetical protein